MDSIDIYNDAAIILDRKNPKIISSWIIVLVLISLIVLSISFVPFNIYKSYNGYITIVDDKSYLVLIINKSDFPIYKDKKLYIKRDLYNYEVVDISEDTIVLDIKLNDNIKINNNNITVNILKNRITIFEIIKNKIKKGFL